MHSQRMSKSSTVPCQHKITKLFLPVLLLLLTFNFKQKLQTNNKKINKCWRMQPKATIINGDIEIIWKLWPIITPRTDKIMLRKILPRKWLWLSAERLNRSSTYQTRNKQTKAWVYGGELISREPIIWGDKRVCLYTSIYIHHSFFPHFIVSWGQWSNLIDLCVDYCRRN